MVDASSTTPEQALRRIARMLELARLTQRYERDQEFAAFIDTLLTEAMEVTAK